MELTKDLLSFWKAVVEYITKEGYWKLTKVVLFLGFSVCFLYMMKNIGDSIKAEMIFKQKEQIMQAFTETETAKRVEHAEKMVLRENVKPKITAILRETLRDMRADRAFVIELHNGSNNTAGLPFIHCSMTYEEVAKGIEPVDEDYQNLSLSRFNFPEYLHENDYWYGTVDEFAEVDAKVSNRMKTNGATYIVITTIKAHDSEIGYYGFTYCGDNGPRKDYEIVSHLLGKVQELSKLLDNVN